MKNNKKIIIGLCIIILLSCTTANQNKTEDKLIFDPNKFTPEERSMTFLDGRTVTYRSYENIFYVSNIIDPECQFLNFYVPESAYFYNSKTPIFLKTNIGGYMASRASEPSNIDATGRALLEGYIVVIPGSRGWNSRTTGSEGHDTYPGRVPAALVDLKAAIRYLRHNTNRIPGDTERIIIDGTSAGGAMAALVGATGNNPAYDSYLKALGAANERDDVFAAVCFCPITDLEHADMAYEWLYSGTNKKGRDLSPAAAVVSEDLAAMYPDYLETLGLKTPDGTTLTVLNYREYLKTFLIASAQKARDAGTDMPPETGVVLNADFRRSPGEIVMDIDLDLYLDYVVSEQPLKSPPAFDSLGVLNSNPTPENNEFGDDKGNAANFTDFSLQMSGDNPYAAVSPDIKTRVHLMNPMNFIGDEESRTAQYWYIRHGAVDRDTSFQISINLYTKLVNHGYDANFALPWNRKHQGDYDLNDVFTWIEKILSHGKK